MKESMPISIQNLMSLYKFADDGTIQVSHESLIECYKIMQNICNYLSLWCRQNKLVINCDINKTEAIILKTDNPTNVNNIPELEINGKHINYVKQTKVLGIILDENLEFEQHALQKLKDCNKKWGVITKSTNRRHGLNVRSLTLLLKTMVLTKIHYAAPLWLYTNLHQFKSFWNNAIMKITGAMLFPPRDITEIALQLPPMDIQLDLLTVKFLCKCLTANDNMASIVYQVEGSLSTYFHKQLRAIRNFISWRLKNSTPPRNIELLKIGRNILIYTKELIINYEEHIWMNKVINKIKNEQNSSSQEEVTVGIAQHVLTSQSGLSKKNFLFNHYTTKEEDSFLLDFLHGNSLILDQEDLSLEMKTVICVPFVHQTRKLMIQSINYSTVHS